MQSLGGEWHRTFLIQPDAFLDSVCRHEAVGFVCKLGCEVHELKEGDRVAGNAVTPCYKCDNCLRGFSSQCTQALGGWKFANIKDGVFAEYFHVNDAQANAP